MKVTRNQIRNIIREWFSDEHDPATGKRDQYSAPDLIASVQEIVDSGSSAIMDMADTLQGMGFPDAEYISGMGMRYVEVTFKGKKHVIISKNQVEPDPDTQIVGPYAIGVLS